MSSLAFLKRGNGPAGQSSLVDTHPLQTADALAPLAITAEEKEFAHVLRKPEALPAPQ